MGLSRQALAYRSRQFGEIRWVFGDDPLGLSAQNADIFRSELLGRHHDNGDIRERGTLARREHGESVSAQISYRLALCHEIFATVARRQRAFLTLGWSTFRTCSV
jgi:hypothetical protein